MALSCRWGRGWWDAQQRVQTAAAAGVVRCCWYGYNQDTHLLPERAPGIQDAAGIAEHTATPKAAAAQAAAQARKQRTLGTITPEASQRTRLTCVGSSDTEVLSNTVPARGSAAQAQAKDPPPRRGDHKAAAPSSPSPAAIVIRPTCPRPCLFRPPLRRFLVMAARGGRGLPVPSARLESCLCVRVQQKKARAKARGLLGGYQGGGQARGRVGACAFLRRGLLLLQFCLWPPPVFSGLMQHDEWSQRVHVWLCGSASCCTRQSIVEL
jgi:hypothetical protein